MPASESLRALLAGSIDYAGLFPPAGLAMREAVARYAADRRGPCSWMLGRFVVPVGSLEEFAAARAAIRRGAGGVWPLAVLLSGESNDETLRVAEFAGAQAERARIEAVEFKATASAEIAARARALPPALERYCELPWGADLERFLPVLKGLQLRAKFRTGGITAAAFPTAAALARYLVASARAGVPFKATAGLHHPLRGSYRLTYESHSARAPMHGMLNLMLAAAFARQGWSAARLESLLLDGEAGNFSFRAEAAVWRDQSISTTELELARRAYICSFGSCSFSEPTAELRALDWL